MVLLGACLGWLVFSGLAARHALLFARADVSAVRAALLRSDPASATRLASVAASEAAAARSDVAGLPWVVAADVPWLGAPARSVRGLAAAVDDLTHGALPEVVQAGAALQPDLVHPAGDQVDLALLTQSAPTLASALFDVRGITAQVAALPAHTWFASADRARAELLGQLTSLTGTLADASEAAQLLPPMLGADGPRRYFVALQTNAEARGTGGLVGGYAILYADHGRLSLAQLGLDTQFPAVPTPVTDLGPAYDALYGRYGTTTTWGNTNLSPNFPDAARIWTAWWQRQTGEALDGAIATDPVTLGYLLGATGPVTLSDGEEITSTNAVALVESTAYARFSDEAARQTFLIDVAHAVIDSLLHGSGHAVALGHALGLAAGERRLLVWSRVPAEEAELGRTPLGGVLAPNTGPYVFLVVNNGAANKMDYYLARTLTYTAGACRGATRDSRITVTLTNTAAASGLPASVAGDSSIVLPGLEFSPGDDVSLLSLYLTPGAELLSATEGGQPLPVAVAIQDGHPVLITTVLTPPGGSETLTFDLVEPVVPGPATVPVQPLVLPQRSVVDVPACTTRPGNRPEFP
ncbi:MAG: DUF4012 domain-containing protein [Mycobacteriales bacterium]